MMIKMIIYYVPNCTQKVIHITKSEPVHLVKKLDSLELRAVALELPQLTGRRLTIFQTLCLGSKVI
jgi:hypothetical protein